VSNFTGRRFLFGGIQLLVSLHAEVKRFGGDPGGVDAWLTPQP